MWLLMQSLLGELWDSSGWPREVRQIVTRADRQRGRPGDRREGRENLEYRSKVCVKSRSSRTKETRGSRSSADEEINLLVITGVIYFE